MFLAKRAGLMTHSARFWYILCSYKARQCSFMSLPCVVGRTCSAKECTCIIMPKKIDSLSPLLFIMYVNSILKRVAKGDALAPMYTDDLVVMTKSIDELQWALTRLTMGCGELHMEPNVSKTKWMAFGKVGPKKEN